MLMNSINCEVGYRKYDAVGSLLDERQTESRLFETYYGDEQLYSTCIEVCTTYTTDDVVFTSTYRVAGDQDTCAEVNNTYSAAGEPYNTPGSLIIHTGWREDEIINYSSSTTVICCSENDCNNQCPELLPPSLDVASRMMPALGFSTIFSFLVAACSFRR